MDRVHVTTDQRSYYIHIVEDDWSTFVKSLDGAVQSKKLLIRCEDNVHRLDYPSLDNILTQAEYEHKVAVIPHGETTKNLEWAEVLYTAALNAKLDRQSTRIALGGGVVGDIAGFIAATYMRGINLGQIPTTMLAQIDSSVGGKVAVNHPKAKNIIGAF